MSFSHVWKSGREGTLPQPNRVAIICMVWILNFLCVYDCVRPCWNLVNCMHGTKPLQKNEVYILSTSTFWSNQKMLLEHIKYASRGPPTKNSLNNVLTRPCFLALCNINFDKRLLTSWDRHRAWTPSPCRQARSLCKHPRVWRYCGGQTWWWCCQSWWRWQWLRWWWWLGWQS